jgi:hypothetical protein
VNADVSSAVELRSPSASPASKANPDLPIGSSPVPTSNRRSIEVNRARGSRSRATRMPFFNCHVVTLNGSAITGCVMCSVSNRSSTPQAISSAQIATDFTLQRYYGTAPEFGSNPLRDVIAVMSTASKLSPVTDWTWSNTLSSQSALGSPLMYQSLPPSARYTP